MGLLEALPEEPLGRKFLEKFLTMKFEENVNCAKGELTGMYIQNNVSKIDLKTVHLASFYLSLVCTMFK